MAAQAAVGVFVCGPASENRIRLESEERPRLVTDLLMELAVVVPGSATLLRGSLAEGRADPNSDIDLLWDVPDAAFSAPIAALPVTLERVRSVASLRFDSDFQHSAKRRSAFIRGLPGRRYSSPPEANTLRQPRSWPTRPGSRDQSA